MTFGIIFPNEHEIRASGKIIPEPIGQAVEELTSRMSKQKWKKINFKAVLALDRSILYSKIREFHAEHFGIISFKIGQAVSSRTRVNGFPPKFKSPAKNIKCRESPQE